MTNREKLLTEIGSLSDGQLLDLLMVGYSGINPEGDFGLVICGDCRAGHGGECARPDEDTSCGDIETDWLRAECVRDRLLGVKT